MKDTKRDYKTFHIEMENIVANFPSPLRDSHT